MSDWNRSVPASGGRRPSSIRIGPSLAVIAVLVFGAQPGGRFLLAANPPVPDFSWSFKSPVSSDLPITVLLELESPATSKVFLKTLAEGTNKLGLDPETSRKAANLKAKESLKAIRLEQERCLQSLKGAGVGFTEVFRVQRTLNGIAVQVPLANLKKLESLPGVGKVEVLPLHQTMTASSIPFVGFPQAWSSRPECLAGEGIRIGILDTGIDYVHRNFGGSGLPADYTSNNPVVLEPETFPTQRVVGGIDLAGDDYDPRSMATSIPSPDPDPMDCNGHGSHVAGIAGGGGITVDNSAYLGPYGNSLDFSSFKVGPGAAPESMLYAIKVFGCEGPTSLTIAGIEWAVDPNEDGDFSDRLDVLNMSLGFSYGFSEDLSTQAANAAAQLGVVVVASSGNSGDDFFISASPAAGEWVVGVGGTVDDGILVPNIVVSSPADLVGRYPAGRANFGPPLDATGITGQVAAADPILACATLSNPDELVGKVALVDRGSCNFTEKVLMAQEAGAIAAVVIDNVPGAIPGTMANSGLGSQISIPSLQISLEDGSRIKSRLAEGVVVTLKDSPGGDTIFTNSSRGPTGSLDRVRLKPDISAPGFRIFSTASGNGTEGTLFSGTSMSAPHVAGALALLHQKHPTWSVPELKALAMNTADQDVFFDVDQTPPRYGAGRIGAGRMEAGRMVESQVIAFDSDHPEEVSLSFGYLPVVASASVTKSLTLRNKGEEAVEFQIAYHRLTQIPGVLIDFPEGNTVSVPAHSSVQREVVLSVPDASLLRHTRDVTVAASQSGPRHWLSEESGAIRLIPLSGNQSLLRVPLYATIRPASDREIGEGSLTFGPGALGQSSIALEGIGLPWLGEGPEGQGGLIAAFELIKEDPAEVDQEDPRSVSDIRFLGIASDYKSAGSVEDTTLFFAIASAHPWKSPNGVSFFVSIDPDEDGVFEFDVVNTNQAALGNAGTDDVFVNAILDRESNSRQSTHPLNFLSPQERDTAPFNTNVMILPVPATAIGLSQENSDFDLRAVSTFLSDSSVVDEIPSSHYDLKRPGFDFLGPQGGNLFLDDRSGAISLPFDYDLEAFSENGSVGALVVLPFDRKQNSALAAIVTSATTDLQISVSGFPSTVASGSHLTYTIAMKNDGPARIATGVEVMSFLPPGVRFISASPLCEETASGMRCRVGALAAGFVTGVTLEVLVLPEAVGSLVHVVSIEGREFDPNLSDNLSRWVNTVKASATASPTPTSIAGATATPLPEDIDEDGEVDQEDLLRLLLKWKHSD